VLEDEQRFPLIDNAACLQIALIIEKSSKNDQLNPTP
jgi:hypothetical protein